MLICSYENQFIANFSHRIGCNCYKNHHWNRIIIHFTFTTVPRTVSLPFESFNRIYVWIELNSVHSSAIGRYDRSNRNRVGSLQQDERMSMRFDCNFWQINVIWIQAKPNEMNGINKKRRRENWRPLWCFALTFGDRNDNQMKLKTMHIDVEPHVHRHNERKMPTEFWSLSQHWCGMLNCEYFLV